MEGGALASSSGKRLFRGVQPLLPPSIITHGGKVTQKRVLALVRALHRGGVTIDNCAALCEYFRSEPHDPRGVRAAVLQWFPDDQHDRLWTLWSRAMKAYAVQ